jgi:excisionase family DNA binding protein
VTIKPPRDAGPAPDRLLSIHSSAELLSVCTKTVRRFVKSGALPYHRVGRQIRISQKDLNVFVALNRNADKGVH